MTRLSELNTCSRERFVAICGPFFEHSPWIAQRSFDNRPFADLDDLHQKMVRAVTDAPIDEQVRLIASHPDLVGKLAREGKLTRESTGEQTAAGLTALSDAEIARFEQYNAAYRGKFGFPFVICARENRKEAILAAIPVRLNNSRVQEIQTALAEIAKIARLRLFDAVEE
jgi:OHCU decarboxylase